MHNDLIYRHTRRFSTKRLTAHSRQQLQRLSLTMDDVNYTYVCGTHIRLGKRRFIVLRRRDIAVDARALPCHARREGIMLEMDQRGWIRDIVRDRNACRKLRSHHGEVVRRPRRTRLG